MTPSAFSMGAERGEAGPLVTGDSFSVPGSRSHRGARIWWGPGVQPPKGGPMLQRPLISIRPLHALTKPKFSALVSPNTVADTPDCGKQGFFLVTLDPEVSTTRRGESALGSGSEMVLQTVMRAQPPVAGGTSASPPLAGGFRLRSATLSPAHAGHGQGPSPGHTVPCLPSCMAWMHTRWSG